MTTRPVDLSSFTAGMRSEQNGRHPIGDVSKGIFLDETDTTGSLRIKKNHYTLVYISLKFVHTKITTGSNKMLDEQSSCRWFETLRHSCDVTVTWFWLAALVSVVRGPSWLWTTCWIKPKLRPEWMLWDTLHWCAVTASTWYRLW